MSLTIYHYPACSTCKKALSFLRDRGVKFDAVHIVETPPTKRELKAMGQAMNGDLKKLFNTSGEVYRALGLKARLASMTEEEMIELLAKNGKLIKRPFAIGAGVYLVGFREEAWDRAVCRETSEVRGRSPFGPHN